MAENNENFKKLKRDLEENPKKVMERYLKNFNFDGSLKVDQANMLVKVILKEYGVKLEPWKVEDGESG